MQAFSVAEAPLTARAAVVLLLGLCGGCTRWFVAAGPTADVGTLGVSGLEGGLGGHLEIGLLHDRGRSALGGVLSGTLAGYSSAGDADPVFLTTLELRSRHWLGTSTRSVRPFVEVGGGGAVMWSAGPQAGGLVGHIAAGLQGGGTGTQWWVAIRERPAGLLGGQAEFFNSVQLTAGLEIRRTGSR
jgi:hypothetical protein